MLITDPETLGTEETSVRLLADSSDTGGAASIENVRLAAGQSGATPHYHRISHEVFYIVDGGVDFLEGQTVHRLSGVDAVVVEPGTVHAFAATAKEPANVLIMVTPGVERFEYFRQLERTLRGIEPPEALARRQEEFDTYFVESEVWDERNTHI